MSPATRSPDSAARSGDVRNAAWMTVGVFAVLGGLVLLALGIGVLAQSDGERVDLGTGTAGGDAAAISSVPLDWDAESYLGAPLESVEFTATAPDASTPLFIGLTTPEEADRLLDGEARTIDDGNRFEHTEHTLAGTPADPRDLDIWSARATGDGAATLQFAPSDAAGEQVLVIMTADGEALGTLDIASGAEAPLARTLSIAAVAAGGVLTVGGLVLTTITVRRAAAARRRGRS